MAYNPNQPRAKNGEWGAGESGTHAAGVNGVGKAPISSKAINAILKCPDGCSVRPDGSSPKDGYMVAQSGRSQILDSLSVVDGKHVIAEFARKNADALKDPSAHIGVWKDSASGKVYLDIANNMHSRTQAIRSGKSANQIAIYDVKRQKEIRTGGTGT